MSIFADKFASGECCLTSSLPACLPPPLPNQRARQLRGTSEEEFNVNLFIYLIDFSPASIKTSFQAKGFRIRERMFYHRKIATQFVRTCVDVLFFFNMNADLYVVTRGVEQMYAV